MAVELLFLELKKAYFFRIRITVGISGDDDDDDDDDDDG